MSFAALFLFSGVSFASTSVRLQQPQTPTNQNAFNITFVALDTNSSQVVTVQCQKQGPGDSNPVNFGSPITLSAGGNTNVCQVGNGLLNQNGTYQFDVIAYGSSTTTSNTVNVDFNTDGPGTPGNYNKTKPDNCTYEITFRTADDNGKTVKVVLYRSSNQNFSLDNGTQVNQVSIGSNTDGSMTDNISPNCNTNYYYAIRAFDKYGNGSGATGDSSTSTTIISPTVTQQEGAIAGGTAGNVLGAEAGGQGQVLGTESAKPTQTPAKVTGQNPVSNAVNWVLTHKKVSLLVLIILAAIAYFLYRRYYKK